MEKKVYYALKYKRSGNYYTRSGSSSPALFSSVNKAQSTMNQHLRADEYTIVKFAEVE